MPDQSPAQGIRLNDWVIEQIQELLKQKKTPTEIHLTLALERKLVADHRRDMGGDLPKGFKDSDIRKVYSTIDGAKVVWDQPALLIRFESSDAGE